MNGFLAKIQGEGPLAELGADQVTELILSAKASRLLAHVLDQLGPLDAVGKSGKILH